MDDPNPPDAAERAVFNMAYEDGAFADALSAYQRGLILRSIALLQAEGCSSAWNEGPPESPYEWAGAMVAALDEMFERDGEETISYKLRIARDTISAVGILQGIFEGKLNRSFPWPQHPSLSAVRKVAAAAEGLRQTRTDLLKKHRMSLRDLYRSMELPGEHPLKQAHGKLDIAVREAYGMTPKQDVLRFLLDLNATVAAREAAGMKVQGPGLPYVVVAKRQFTTADALSP